uniref:Bloodthirsty-related gene family, member 30 n=1 Tax=Gasterosteus aculeatus aculeatus TaxID=481459 RepID=G3PPF6_GASAC
MDNVFSEQELTCSICLDLFDEPVSTPCGHNYCQACIGGYWASSSVCTCPLCKRQFEERPQLSVNKVFALIANKYKASRYGTAGFPTPLSKGTQQGDAGAPPSGEEVVWCDVCTGVKEPAVSSCLTCTASYCALHLQPHRTTSFYSRHPLMDPQEAFRGRTCPAHHRLLEVFCRTCQRCICAICVLEEHRTHQTVSVQTERLGKQRGQPFTFEGGGGRRSDRRAVQRAALTVRPNYADGERAEVEHLLDQLTGSLARIRSQLVGGIDNQLDMVMVKGEGLVSRLEAELGQLMDRRAMLEVQAVSQDHIGFLQSFNEATSPLSEEQEEVDVEDFSLHFQLMEVKSSLSDLKEKMEDLRTGDEVPRGSGEKGPVCAQGRVNVASIKPPHLTASLSPEDVTLNPVTAYPFLILSEDRKQVKRGEKLQFYRTSQQRFDVWSCVIAKETFSTGRHYWEVRPDWKLGRVQRVCTRESLIDMNLSKGELAIWWSGSQLRALTAPPLTKVKGPPKLRQVGVFLDVDEGQVSFYNVKSGSEIYSFTGSSEFTERMFPLLGTGDKDVPLVLMTSQHQLA